jgi:hypothetical protein|tara:strand:- start:305 stop:418 length:114 start_codon:yes stop_codon:yes gene_type:complete
MGYNEYLGINGIFNKITDNIYKEKEEFGEEENLWTTS